MFIRHAAMAIGTLLLVSVTTKEYSETSSDIPLAAIAVDVLTAAEAKAAPTTYMVGWYATWGHEGSCYGSGGPGGDPDLQDIWVEDNLGNPYYAGHTAHNGCDGPHNGDFYYTSAWQQCLSDNSNDCPMITGVVGAHVHHGCAFREEQERNTPIATAFKSVVPMPVSRRDIR